jgi:hypothetical protein
VFAFTDGFLAKVKVEGGWGYDVDEVAGVDERVRIGESLQLVVGGDFRGDRVIGVIESHQFCSFYLFPVVQMKFPEVTNAKNTHFKHLLNFILPQNYRIMVRIPSTFGGVGLFDGVC